MVTITNYLERNRKDGSSFIVLEITGKLIAAWCNHGVEVSVEDARVKNVAQFKSAIRSQLDSYNLNSTYLTLRICTDFSSGYFQSSLSRR